MARIEIDGATLARRSASRSGLPITDAEAETLARALETSRDDEASVASSVSALRFLVDQLEQSEPDALNHLDRTE